MIRPVLFAILFTVAASSVRAEDWPGFRGPTGQGISSEKNLPVSWDAKKNIAWRTEVAGEGWSSPIVSGGRVFLTATRDGGASCRVISINAEDGKLLWDVEVFIQSPGRKEKRNSHSTPTPVTDGKAVYAFFSAGGAVALDFDGKVLWKNTDLQFYSRHGLGSSPILHKDLLIMPWDHSTLDMSQERLGWQIPWDKSYVLALDKNTGKERYKAQRGQSRIAHMTPRIVEVDGKPQLVSAAGDFIQAFDPDTGVKIWEVESNGEGTTPSPVFGNGVVYASSGFPTPIGNRTFRTTIRAFKLGGSGNMTQQNLLWEQKTVVTTIPSLLLADNFLYCLSENGAMTAMNLADGQILWKDQFKGKYGASPVYADGKIYITNDEGNTTVLSAGREPKEIAFNELNEKTQASLAIANGRIFIRTDKAVWCIRN